MEILVVVTIIGILAAIAVPSYIGAVEQGRRDACATNVRILTTQVERYRLVTGEPILNLGEKESLIDFLKKNGYLIGEEMKCPFAYNETECRYILHYDGNQQTVHCTHCCPPGK